jgi:ribosomal protein S18 acetylase RimI-like enzyme
MSGSTAVQVVPPERVLRMRRSLSERVSVPIWPVGIHLEMFSESQAPAAHALLRLAYAAGGGAVAPFEEWWNSLSNDHEYEPALCFPVYESTVRLIGFAQCWTTAFVKDLVVHPAYQRRGIGRALLLQVSHIFAERGAKTVDLKVQRDNPTAILFYESLGMFRVQNTS